MSKDVDISIVMATFNGRSFIRQQLKSLGGQSLLPKELIIADDGSTDGTIEIIESFSETSPFPVILKRNPERLGYSNNFFSAAQLASSPYIAFCDQDDIWERSKLKVCADALTKHRPLLCAHMATLIDANSVHIGTLQNGPNKPGIFKPLSLAPWATFVGFTMVFDARLIKMFSPSLRGGSYWGEKLPLAHDSWIYLLATSLGKTVVLPEILAQYRQHGKNASGLSPRSIFSRLSLRMGPVASTALDRSNVAARFSKIFDEISPEIFDVDTMQAASKRWAKVSAIELSREALYTQPRFFARLFCLTEVVLKGGYKAYNRGGLGPWILTKDLSIGLFRIRKAKI